MVLRKREIRAISVLWLNGFKPSEIADMLGVREIDVGIQIKRLEKVI